METKSGLKVTAEYLIVTVPLSILKLNETHDYGIKWNPPLPFPTQNFINTMDFAALGKVIFEFNSVWWDPNEDHFLVIRTK